MVTLYAWNLHLTTGPEFEWLNHLHPSSCKRWKAISGISTACDDEYCQVLPNIIKAKAITPSCSCVQVYLVNMPPSKHHSLMAASNFPESLDFHSQSDILYSFVTSQSCWHAGLKMLPIIQQGLFCWSAQILHSNLTVCIMYKLLWLAWVCIQHCIPFTHWGWKKCIC